MSEGKDQSVNEPGTPTREEAAVDRVAEAAEQSAEQAGSTAQAKPATETQESAASEKPAPAEKPAAKPEATAKPAAAPKPAPPKKEAPPPDPRVVAATEQANLLKAALIAEFGEDAVVEAGAAHTKPMVLLHKDSWAKAVAWLKTAPEWQLNYIECMAGTDYKDYIEVLIYIQSTELNHFICLKTRTERDAAAVPSLVAIHPGVNWEEREIYDLLGVTFTDHPDLRRIMMWDEFEGHPLRKDYSEWGNR